jgi:hypothetical protein
VLVLKFLVLIQRLDLAEIQSLPPLLRNLTLVGKTLEQALKSTSILWAKYEHFPAISFPVPGLARATSGLAQDVQTTPGAFQAFMTSRPSDQMFRELETI